ncbi:MAG: hypothetical protein V1792_02310 [Pseudomonadota bacterium]
MLSYSESAIGLGAKFTRAIEEAISIAVLLALSGTGATGGNGQGIRFKAGSRDAGTPPQALENAAPYL